MPVHSSRAWYESWSPDTVHLQPAGPGSTAKEDDPHHGHLSRGLSTTAMDDSPLSYFLTPTTYSLPDGEMDSLSDDYYSSSYAHAADDTGDDFMDFEMDAGIEDTTRPTPMVRSISPSLVSGLPLPRHRPPPSQSARNRARTATRSTDRSTLAPRNGRRGEEAHASMPTLRRRYGEDDDTIVGSDTWTHVRSPPPSNQLLSPEWSPSPLSLSPSSPTVPIPIPIPASRGRSPVYSSTHGSSGRTMTSGSLMPLGRRSPRSWRVPDPDVFSIEEETEQQILDGPAMGRTKKHVRFVLPDEEMI